MSKRSRGRSNPSRGARVERRKEARRRAAAGPSGPTVMRIPDAVRNLTDQPKETDRG